MPKYAYNYQIRYAGNPIVKLPAENATYDETLEVLQRERFFGNGCHALAESSYSFDRFLADAKQLNQPYGIIFVRSDDLEKDVYINSDQAVAIYQFKADETKSFDDVLKQKPAWINKNIWPDFCKKMQIEDQMVEKELPAKPKQQTASVSSASVLLQSSSSSSSRSQSVSESMSSEESFDDNSDELLNLKNSQTLKSSLNKLFNDREIRLNARHKILERILELDDKKMLQMAYEHPFFGRHVDDAKTREALNKGFKKLFSTTKPLMPTESQKQLKAKIDELTKAEKKLKK